MPYYTFTVTAFVYMRALNEEKARERLNKALERMDDDEALYGTLTIHIPPQPETTLLVDEEDI